jgi:hypothetical protein
MKTLAAILAALSASLLWVGQAAAAPAPQSAPSSSSSGPDPNEVYFKTITYSGSGCPISPPSAQVVFAGDKQTFTVLFDKFIASVGQGVAVTENRKNCQLNIGIHIPGGWQYSIVSADFRGFASLDKGVTGLQQSIYYFQGYSHTTTTQATLNGPMQQNYNFRDQVDFQSISWSPCGEDRPVNINTSIFVSNTKNPKGKGLLTTDSIDGKVKQIYEFKWQKCKK